VHHLRTTRRDPGPRGVTGTAFGGGTLLCLAPATAELGHQHFPAGSKDALTPMVVEQWLLALGTIGGPCRRLAQARGKASSTTGTASGVGSQV